MLSFVKLPHHISAIFDAIYSHLHPVWHHISTSLPFPARCQKTTTKTTTTLVEDTCSRAGTNARAHVFQTTFATEKTKISDAAKASVHPPVFRSVGQSNPWLTGPTEIVITVHSAHLCKRVSVCLSVFPPIRLYTRSLVRTLLNPLLHSLVHCAFIENKEKSVSLPNYETRLRFWHGHREKGIKPYKPIKPCKRQTTTTKTTTTTTKTTTTKTTTTTTKK